MLLFVGLGNPTPDSENNRHNVGFKIIDSVNKKFGLSKQKPKFKGLLTTGNVGDQKIYAIKPLTFMNNSGLSVAKVINFYKINPEEMLIIHDELDLAPGDIRLKNGGGHGGHNGLKSIINSIGTNNFWRLRIGIGHPGDKNLVKSYVLKRPTKIEETEINDSIIKGYQILSHLINGSYEKAMLNLHTKD